MYSAPQPKCNLLHMPAYQQHIIVENAPPRTSFLATEFCFLKNSFISSQTRSVVEKFGRRIHHTIKMKTEKYKYFALLERVRFAIKTYMHLVATYMCINFMSTMLFNQSKHFHVKLNNFHFKLYTFFQKTSNGFEITPNILWIRTTFFHIKLEAFQKG